MNFPEIPNYYIDSLINSGGTAAVYLGLDERSGFPVAIKALFPNHAKDNFVLQHFRAEASYYCHLSHPNLTRLVDFFEDGDKYYLIMEYVEGMPLDEYLNAMTSPMSDETLITMFCQILEPIAYIHQKHNLMHLDIKPSNIMIQNNGNIKILDMGISAKLNDKNNNLKRCGSPAFMAPEQINQEELGFFTDIFALGVTFFNMITGHLPFAGANHTEIFEKICNEQTPQAKDFYPDVSSDFQTVIERSLQKKGCDRYQTCEEFQMELLAIAARKKKNKKNKI